MERFDVYRMPGAGGQGYVIDVQAELLSHLATRIVVPLLPEVAVPKPIKELNPIFEIEGENYVMMTQSLASILRRELKHVILSLSAQHGDITRALDILFMGY